ncbi:neutral/alkaline non-lysosomal ceramidase N-terminal domain-containing protein [Bacteroidota bacterium]
MRKILLLTVLSSFLILTFHYADGSENIDDSTNRWKAGVARVIITPEEPIWMAGYSSRNRPSEGILHDIWAKALALEDARGERGVLITTDLIGFSGKYISGRIRNRLKTKYGLTSSQVILSSSHTHTGPELMRAPEDYLGREDTIGPFSPVHREIIRKYSEKLENQIVNIVGEALNSMEPVKIFSSQGVARFAVNRRVHNARRSSANSDGHIEELTQSLDGPVDHSVPVIKVKKLSGKLLAVVFGYACHNTTTGSIMQISGDYAGFAQIALEEAFPGATAMFFAGAGADQNPLPRFGGYTQQYGKTLAAAVEKVLLDEDELSTPAWLNRMRELTPHLITAYSEVDLKFANPPPTKDELLEVIEKSSSYPGRAKNLLYRLEQGESLMTSYAYPVQTWQIGEQKLVVLASEVVIDYAIRLKQIYGPDLFVMAYANEGMGYIPSTRVLGEDRFGVFRKYEGSISANFTGPWASDIEMMIVLNVIRLFEQAGVE